MHGSFAALSRLYEFVGRRLITYLSKKVRRDVLDPLRIFDLIQDGPGEPPNAEPRPRSGALSDVALTPRKIPAARVFFPWSAISVRSL